MSRQNSLRLSVGALLLGITYWWIFLPGEKLSDPSTLLVLPMRVQGQEEGAEFVGRALAEAIAVNLAQAPELTILPVPSVPVIWCASTSGLPSTGNACRTSNAPATSSNLGSV